MMVAIAAKSLPLHSRYHQAPNFVSDLQLSAGTVKASDHVTLNWQAASGGAGQGQTVCVSLALLLSHSQSVSQSVSQLLVKPRRRAAAAPAPRQAQLPGMRCSRCITAALNFIRKTVLGRGWSLAAT